MRSSPNLRRGHYYIATASRPPTTGSCIQRTRSLPLTANEPASSTSSGVIAPITNLGLSNALRSTLIGWSKTLANEVGGHGITANVVLPGRIATRRILSLDQARADREGRTREEVSTASVATIPVGRYGRPDEYGSVVAFIASQPASFLNGSIVRVDGGMIPSV
jgi:3-oxoacyl-[acyl-carrier protein] reductase